MRVCCCPTTYSLYNSKLTVTSLQILLDALLNPACKSYPAERISTCPTAIFLYTRTTVRSYWSHCQLEIVQTVIHLKVTLPYGDGSQELQYSPQWHSSTQGSCSFWTFKFHDFSMITEGNSMTFWVPSLVHAKDPSHMHQNITENITFYVGPECHFCYGIFQFSMTSDIFEDLCDFSRPGNQSFKFHDFPGFSWLHEPCQHGLALLTNKKEVWTGKKKCKMSCTI